MIKKLLICLNPNILDYPDSGVLFPATRYLAYQVVLGSAGDMGDTRIGILRSPLSVHRAIVALNLSPHSTACHPSCTLLCHR